MMKGLSIKGFSRWGYMIGRNVGLVGKQKVRIAIIAVTTRQCVCIANRALIMSVNMYQFNYVPAKNA